MERSGYLLRCLVFVCVMQQCVLAAVCTGGIAASWGATKMNKDLLKQVFSQYGVVESVDFSQYYHFGKVKMKNQTDSDVAISKLLKTDCVTKLNVKCATPKLFLELGTQVFSEPCQDKIFVDWPSELGPQGYSEPGVVNKELLETLFSQYGEVESVFLPVNGNLGFGKVKMKDQGNTVAAMNGLDGYCAVKLDVNCAMPLPVFLESYDSSKAMLVSQE